VKILQRKLDDMERSYDVLLDEVKQMRVRVEGKDSHVSQTSPGNADKTHEEKIQACDILNMPTNAYKFIHLFINR